MYKACIFDLDGTLLNTLHTIAHYSNKALEHFGFEKLPLEKYQVLCRLSYKEYYKTLLKFGGCPEDQTEDLYDQIGTYDHQAYLEDALYLTRPYEGINELLEKLAEKRITLAVLTNKPDHVAQKVITALFPDTFDLCVGQLPDQPAKPDPNALRRVVDLLGLQKDECIYVGDTDVDIKTAKGAGVYSIAAAWGYQPIEMLEKNEPDELIHRPEEVLAYYR
ncbi:MAG: hydrolase, family variant 1 [Bacillota bacterium]|jgi:phosphoglycolate phosphatase|nr:hydrolase, family variant 1 [Bacillota bacterium]